MGKVENEGRDVMVIYLHFVQFVGPSLDGSLHKRKLILPGKEKKLTLSHIESHEITWWAHYCHMTVA